MFVSPRTFEPDGKKRRVVPLRFEQLAPTVGDAVAGKEQQTAPGANVRLERSQIVVVEVLCVGEDDEIDSLQPFGVPFAVANFLEFQRAGIQRSESVED